MLESVLIDSVQLYSVAPSPVTVGSHVSRPLSAVGNPVPGLVQQTTLENAVESRSEALYSAKVGRATPIAAGMAVKVLTCAADPSLVGKIIFIDKVSGNGMAMIRKGVGTISEVVNTEGKEGLVA